MVSVRTESLENAEAVLEHEVAGLQEIEDCLKSVRMHLAIQGNRTFSAQKLSLSKQIIELEREIQTIKELRNSLESIEQLYRDCEKKNTALYKTDSGHLFQFIDVSMNIWDNFINNAPKLAGTQKEYPRYEKSIVDRTYDDWIRPMMK